MEAGLIFAKYWVYKVIITDVTFLWEFRLSKSSKRCKGIDLLL